jgi:hypothetical protein
MVTDLGKFSDVMNEKIEKLAKDIADKLGDEFTMKTAKFTDISIFKDGKFFMQVTKNTSVKDALRMIDDKLKGKKAPTKNVGKQPIDWKKQKSKTQNGNTYTGD